MESITLIYVQCSISNSLKKCVLLKFECAWCHKTFQRKKHGDPYSNSKSGLLFCNRACKEMAQRVGGLSEIQPSHYKDGSSNYREIAFRNFPHKCNRCGWDKEPALLEAHHKDRNRENGALSES